MEEYLEVESSSRAVAIDMAAAESVLACDVVDWSGRFDVASGICSLRSRPLTAVNPCAAIAVSIEYLGAGGRPCSTGRRFSSSTIDPIKSLVKLNETLRKW